MVSLVWSAGRIYCSAPSSGRGSAPGACEQWPSRRRQSGDSPTNLDSNFAGTSVLHNYSAHKHYKSGEALSETADKILR
jgi:hypothetical protein